MSNSKLMSQFQVTIPQEIRTKTKQVHIKKATQMDLIYLKSLQSTLSEWSSKNDNEAYNDL